MPEANTFGISTTRGTLSAKWGDSHVHTDRRKAYRLSGGERGMEIYAAISPDAAGSGTGSPPSLGSVSSSLSGAAASSSTSPS